MAIVNGYATVDQLQRSLRRTVDSGEANYTWLENCIDYASRFIDNETGRIFYSKPLTSEVIDIFDLSENDVMIECNGVRMLFPSPIISITSITQDGVTLTDGTDFYTYKNSGVIENPSRWSRNRKAIAFTGSIGYSSTPPRITLLCLQIAKALSGLSTSAFTDESGGVTEIIRESIPAWVKSALKKECRILVWG